MNLRFQTFTGVFRDLINLCYHIAVIVMKNQQTLSTAMYLKDFDRIILLNLATGYATAYSVDGFGLCASEERLLNMEKYLARKILLAKEIK